MNLPSLRLNVGSVDIRQIFAGRLLFSNSSSFWRNEPMYGLCLLLTGVTISPRCLLCKEHCDARLCSESLHAFFDGSMSLHITQTCGTFGFTVLSTDAASFLCNRLACSFQASLLNWVCQHLRLTALPILGLDFSP